MEKIYNVLADSATFSYNTKKVDVPIISAPSANALRVEFPYTQGDKLKLRALCKPNSVTSDCLFGFVCDSGDYYITQTASATTTYHYGGKSVNMSLKITATTMSTIELDNNSVYSDTTSLAITSGYTEPTISVNSSGKATLNINGVDINYFEIFNQDERLVFGGYVRESGVMEFFKQPTIGGEVVKDGEMQIPSSFFKSIKQTKEWSNFKELDFGGLELTTCKIVNNYRLEKVKNATFTSSSSINNYIRFCNNLKSFENCTFNISGVANQPYIRLNKLTDFSAEFPNVINSMGMFLGCDGLENANITIPKATSFTSTFAYCTNLKQAKINAPLVTNVTSMFNSCSSLESFDIDLSNVTNVTNMLAICSSLEHVDFNAPKAISSPLWGNYPNLTSVILNLPSCKDSISFSSTTQYPNLKVVNLTTNWSGTASGSSQAVIGKPTEEATLCFNNATYLNKVCSGASVLTRLSLTCPNLTLPTSRSNKPLNNCPSLQHVEITTNSANSGWTMEDVSYGTTPILPYRYVDDLGDGLVRLVFTSEKRSKYKVIVGSDSQSALDAIVVAEDLDNNNTNLTI